MFQPYTFGSMSLGRNPVDISSDLRVARRAMEAGVWFHSSPTYNNGFTFMVLRQAFEADRPHVPKLIIKIRDGSASLMRFEVEDSCRRLGIEAIDVAQLVSMDPGSGNLVDQLRGGGGPLADELASLRARGLVKQAVIYLTPANSDPALEAAEKSNLIDGVILYWNAIQRECTDSAWDAIRRSGLPVLALRTLGGGPSDENSRRKAGDLHGLIARSGCGGPTEFNLRLAASEPCVRTTIGGTASLAHLEEFLAASCGAVPLPADVLAGARRLQTA